MPERTNGTVLKTVEARVSVGSNPTPSAMNAAFVSGLRRVRIVVALVIAAAIGAGAAPAGAASSDRPRVGDHWHEAFAVDVCGEWLPNAPTFESPATNPRGRVGLHTHGDGIIHTHPFTSSEA